MRRTGRAVVLTVVVAALDVGAAPAVKPGVDAATAIRVLTEQGMDALAADNAKAAVEAFLDAKVLCEKQRRETGKEEAGYRPVLQGLGAAYLKLGNFEKAREPLERLVGASAAGSHRAAVLNRAMLDVVQGRPMRA